MPEAVAAVAADVDRGEAVGAAGVAEERDEGGSRMAKSLSTRVRVRAMAVGAREGQTGTEGKRGASKRRAGSAERGEGDEGEGDAGRMPALFMAWKVKTGWTLGLKSSG